MVSTGIIYYILTKFDKFLLGDNKMGSNLAENDVELGSENTMEWQQIFDSLPDLIAVIDLDHKITKVNKAMAESLGVYPEDIVGKSCFCIMHHTQSPPDICPHSQLIKDGKCHSVEFPIEILGGEYAVSVSPIRDANGILTGSVHVAHNITENRKLSKINRYLASIVGSSDDAIFGKDLDGNLISWNKGAEEMFGYTEKEILGKPVSIIVPPDQIVDYNNIIIQILAGKSIKHHDAIRMKKNGERIDVSLHISPMHDSYGIINGSSTIAHDISERKLMERNLKESEEKYREVFTNANDMISLNLMNEDGLPGKFIDVNPVGIARYGYTYEEFLNLTPRDLVAPEERDKMPQNAKKLANDSYAEFELVHMSKDGRRINVEINNHIFRLNNRKVAIAVVRDITERTLMDIKLKKSLSEKEMLLKEIHHRVKNNLMIISSLLSLQSSYIKDKASKNIFIESQNRARSMALIHEKLYQSTDLKRINFGEYIRTLTNELFYTYSVGSGIIELKYLLEDIYLDINTAIPLGLIANELITNSLKYAFPDGNNGFIQVEFKKLDHEYLFKIKDNGVGLPDDLDFKNTESLGLQLVNNLTEQIDGEVELNVHNGTEFRIKFKEMEIK